MKTRMRRFWISVSLAAGSLALPLSGALRAHDLPTRWTSGANSTPSWNYLLDDCLDSPTLPGSQSLTDVEPAARRGTEDWASSCPAEWAADLGRVGRAADIDYESLLRNPISRFSKEMTCWVNEWQMIQQAAGIPSSKIVWAQLPDAGNPPAPDYSIAYLPQSAPAPLSDTCAFDAEYQARQTAAELLAREIARAREIADNEARLSQSLADADRSRSLIEMDAIAEVAAAEGLLVRAEDLVEAPLCGGEASEIMSDQCFAEQTPAWQPELKQFAPGLVDEYVAYDLDARDQHWLGGLGKSWKLRRAISALPVPTELAVNDLDSTAEAWAVPVADEYDSPESFTAPDRVDADLAMRSAENDAEINAYLDGIVQQAQQSAMSLIHSAREQSQPLMPLLPELDVLPELLPNLGQCLGAAGDWVEDQQCQIASELCGMERAFQAGQWLGVQTLSATQSAMDLTIHVGHYLDIPAELQPALDVFVIYVDAEGNSLAVPSSLARAWNRPEAEAAEVAEIESNPAEAIETSVAPNESVAAAEELALLDQLGTQMLSMVAKQLDGIGKRLLQASDLLSSWADMQIASRESSVR